MTGGIRRGRETAGILVSRQPGEHAGARKIRRTPAGPPRRKRARGPAFARRRSPDAPSVFCAATRKARKMLLRPRSGTVPPAVPGRRRTERAGKQRSLPPPFPGEETGFGKEVRPRGSFSLADKDPAPGRFTPGRGCISAVYW